MIKKIKWKQHSILGNLELDFTRENGYIYPTIVVAGENGSGKTTILETLATFLNLGSMEPFEYIDYNVNGQDFHIYPSEEGYLGFHKRQEMPSGVEENIRRNSNNGQDALKADIKDLRSHGVLYSKAKSGFKTNQIKSSTTQQIDSDKYYVDTNDDYTTAKQLLVDLRAQDAERMIEIAEAGNFVSADEFNRTESKMYRFVKAFNEFFDNLEFKKVDNESSKEKRVLFEKNGNEIAVDQLSTGEKQIVFRGTQLLRNSNVVSDGVILIDEPELSMHPRWQEKILEYYMNLFEGNGNQLIVTTHSEYVLRAALKKREDILVIVLENDKNAVKQRKITAPIVLPSITFAETDYLAFKIYSNDFHIELYGCLQNKEGVSTVKATDDFIAGSSAYDATRHRKISSYQNIRYETLPTYIRNAIDHPDNGNTFTDEELKISTELLIQLCGGTGVSV